MDGIDAGHDDEIAAEHWDDDGGSPTSPSPQRHHHAAIEIDTVTHPLGGAPISSRPNPADPR